VIGRRGSRFRDLVARQLELFDEDEKVLLDEAEAADAAWTQAERDETEERYGDYQLVVDAIGERLYELRESYAGRLDQEAADEYRDAFSRAAAKRYPRYASLLEEDP